MDQPQQQSKPKPRRWPWIVGGLFLLFVIVGATAKPSTNTSTPNTNSTTNTSTTATWKPDIGKEGLLRAGATDPILLATDKPSFDELTKALTANDSMGVLQLAAAGKVFGVSSGSRVLVIDRDTFTRKVRILAGVKDIDTDKVGLAGWVPFEWVVAPT